MTVLVNDVRCGNLKIGDSFTSVLPDKDRLERVQSLYNLAFQFLNTDKERCLQLILQAKEAALRLGDTLWIVKTTRVEGQLLYHLERIERATNVLNSILSTAERHKFSKEQAVITNTLGSCYLFEARFDKALKNYFKSADLATQLSDTTLVLSSLNNIGLAYYKLSDYKRALEYFERSLALQKDTKQLNENTLINISLCYAYLNDFSRARKNIDEQLDVSGLTCSDQCRMRIMFANGLISFGLKRFYEAEKYFTTSYGISNKLSDTRWELDNIYYLVQIYVRQNRIKQARGLLTQAEKLTARSLPFNLERIKIYSCFSELYRLTGDYKAAFDYQGRHIQLRDSIYTAELTTNLMKTEAEYLERKNAVKIALQDETIRGNNEIIRVQRVLNVVTCFLVITSLAFIIFLYLTYRKNKDLNRLLEKKVKERTEELELSRDCLVRAMREKDVVIHRTSDGITEAVNTIKGLCFTGTRELSEPVALAYIYRIDKAACCIAAQIANFFPSKSTAYVS